MAGLRRGDIHRVRFPHTNDRRQSGARPGVVIQTNALGKWSTVIVVPLSRSAHDLAFRPKVTIGDTESVAMVDHMASLDTRRIGAHIGSLSASELVDMESAIRTVLAIR